MPGKSVEHRSDMVAGYRAWVHRLTMKQYIATVAVVNFVAAVVVSAVGSAVTGSFSWTWVIGWTVLMTAFFAWWRRGSDPTRP